MEPIKTLQDKFSKYLTEFAEELDPNAGDGSGDGDGGNGEGNKQDPPAGAKKPENMIPKTRFDEVNTKFKDVQKQLDELLKAKADAELEAQKNQGKFEDLFNTASKDLGEYKTKAEQLAARTEALEGIFNEMLETRMAAIPEELHDLIPDHLSPEAKLAWIDKAQAKGVLSGTKKPNEPVGGKTNPNSEGNKKSPQLELKEAEDKARKSGRIEDRIAVAHLKRLMGL